MECPSCLLSLQQQEVQGRRACPECGREMNATTADKRADTDLVPYASLVPKEEPVSPLSSPLTPDAETLWCVPCAAAPRAACWEAGHSLQAARRVRQRLQELRRLEEALLEEQRLRREARAALERGAEECDLQLRRVQDCLRGPGLQLREAERLLEAGRGQGRDQAVALLRAQQSFSISSADWRADAVPLQEDVFLQLSLLLQQQKGLLRQQQQAEGEETETQEQPTRSEEGADQKQSEQSSVARALLLKPCKEEPVEEGKQQPAQDHTPTALVAMNLWDLSSAPPDHLQAEKTALLYLQLQTLVRLRCDEDAAWALQLLTSQAAHLRQLQLYMVSREQLVGAVRRMPRLRALALFGCTEGLQLEPALPPPEQWEAGDLRRLDLRGLPREAVRGLLRAHARSLEELVLRVGTPPEDDDEEERWPYSCRGLHAVLEGLPLPGLRHVTLLRAPRYAHSPAGCAAQRTAVRRALRPNFVGFVSCGACSPCEMY